MTIQKRKTCSCSRAACTALAVLVLLLVTGGCVRRIISRRPAGPLDAAPSQRKAATAAAKPAPRKTIPPDEIVRQTFLQQTQGAFNPLTDNKNVALLETRLRLDPQDLAARLQLAGIYERYSLTEQALDHYKQALNYATQDSESGAAVHEQQAEAAAEGLARCARAAGQGSEAIPLLEAFVKHWPSAGAWNELGMLYDEAAERSAAEQAFRQAAAREPNSAGVHNNLGYNLLLQNKPDFAEAEFRRALELNPKSAMANNNLGVVLARRGETEAAFQQFRMASSDIATAHNNLAVVLLEMGYYERSRDELVKALTARYYFTPPMENFKLVQELLRQRAELIGAGAGLPLSSVRVAPSLALATSPIAPGFSAGAVPMSSPVELDRRSSQKEGGADSKAP